MYATHWPDDGLQAYMHQHAGMSLPRAQSKKLIYLTEGVDRPADLARQLRVSKQAVQQALKELIAKDMVTIEHIRKTVVRSSCALPNTDVNSETLRVSVSRAWKRS